MDRHRTDAAEQAARRAACGVRRVNDRRARNLVERFFNKIKQCRRIATRYDKFAANYLAFIKLAAIRIWLRACESAP
jgi:transposase